MKMDDFFLLPTVCVQYKDGKYFLKNLLYHYEKIEIEKLDLIFPQTKLIETKIFARKSEMESLKEEMFSILENKYKNSVTALGYIETTSACPYKCKMCPKGTNKLERTVMTMSMKVFENVIDSLAGQTDITLHMFGDPLYDESIYEKIMYANNKGIKPSFSTNLVSLKNMNLKKMCKVKIGGMTVSIDSIKPEELSIIRGKITQKQIDESFECLEKIISEAENSKFIEKIYLQCINFKNNEYTKTQLEKYIKCRENVEFYEKPFIEFPNTDKVEEALSTVYKKDEWIWLYHILGMATPYRCMKPWNKKEAAVLSDGSFVPCCMSYNDKSKLGSIVEEGLEDIENGERFLNFRKNIWSGGECGEICNLCKLNKNKIIHSEITEEKIQYLKKLCISYW